MVGGTSITVIVADDISGMSYKVENADVLEWAKGYNGEPFHALLCDPPYHLTSIVKRFGGTSSTPAKDRDGVFERSSRGFMGQTWDGGDIAFRPETWAALADHLYPGAFGMAFASSRGWHRLAVAIEDAGLVIHPAIFGWVYGCLSEDTEILTVDGWKSYQDIMIGSMALCYNVNDGTLTYQPVQEIFEYDYFDTAYHIRSDHTDQIVSRNHRCLVERCGKYVFQQAETLEREEVVPVLATLPELRKALQRGKCGRVPQEASLFAGVRDENIYAETEGVQDWATQGQNELRPEAQAQREGGYLPDMRGREIQTCCMVAEDERLGRRVLLQELPGESQCSRTPDKIFGQWQGEKEPEEGYEGGQKSSLEGRSHLHAQAWQLRSSQVCEMSARISTDGAERRVCNGASFDRCPTPGPMLEAFGSGTSQQPRYVRQCARKPDAVFRQHSAQEVRDDWTACPDLATVTPIFYIGKVWCVRVPTGAFVARRNGRAFITGNSGFPKATRIDTQIDRRAGAEREVVGRARRDAGSKSHHAFEKKRELEFDLTAPATPLARVWEGYRYGLQALKPALEPIIVFQKPYNGKPLDNIVQTGAGALNINDARIPANGEEIRINTWDDGAKPFGGGAGHGYTGRVNASGRWPANFYLDEGAAIRLDILCTGDTSRFFFRVAQSLDDADPVFYCAKASREEREAGLQDFPELIYAQSNGAMAAIARGDTEYQQNIRLNSIKTVRNSHPTVKPIALTRYLATLLLPPADYGPRRLLVPFAGSGSEMVGGLLSGWDFVLGIEMNGQYASLAEARLKHWTGKAIKQKGLQPRLFE